jgi:DNA (cytosine-5)-methyltransferase 1
MINTHKPTFFEFFAGGGMVHQALSSSWKCTFANDFSAKKADAYIKNWGNGELLVRDIQSVQIKDLPGYADLAWGSSPCQDVSLAGAGAGLKGGRSGMFWSFFDLIKGLQDEDRCPRIAVLENVSGLVTSNNGKDFSAVCEAFHNAGFKFGAMIVDAVHWLPQSRPRFFLIAAAPGVIIPSSATTDSPSDRWHSSTLRREQAKLSDDIKQSWVWWNLHDPKPRTNNLVDILEANPSDVDWHETSETQRILGMMTDLHLKRVMNAVAVSSRDGIVIAAGLYKRTRKGVQRAEARFDGIAGCLRTPNGGSSRQSLLIIENGHVRSRLLSKREAARLMGLPDTYVLPERYNDAYHLAGDGVAVPVVRALAESIFEPIIKANRMVHVRAAAG